MECAAWGDEDDFISELSCRITSCPSGTSFAAINASHFIYAICTGTHVGWHLPFNTLEREPVFACNHRLIMLTCTPPPPPQSVEIHRLTNSHIYRYINCSGHRCYSATRKDHHPERETVPLFKTTVPETISCTFFLQNKLLGQTSLLFKNNSSESLSLIRMTMTTTTAIQH